MFVFLYVCKSFCICIRFGFAGASTSWQFARLQELLWWLAASASAAGVMNISARRSHPSLQCRDEYIILHCKKYTIAHPFGASLHSLKWIFKQTRRSKNMWALLYMMTSRKCWWWLWINCSIYCIHFCILWGNHLKTPNVVCDAKHTKYKICTMCHFTLRFIERNRKKDKLYYSRAFFLDLSTYIIRLWSWKFKNFIVHFPPPPIKLAKETLVNMLAN